MCCALAQAGDIFASVKNKDAMKNTEYNVDAICSEISSDAFSALEGLIEDLGLEVTGISLG